VIDPTGRPVTMRMKLKKEKNRRLRVTISLLHRNAPFEPTDPKTCTWGGVPDVINCANFFENWSRGLGAGIPRKTAFPTESVHHPYNSVSTAVLHCDASKSNAPSTKKRKKDHLLWLNRGQSEYGNRHSRLPVSISGILCQR